MMTASAVNSALEIANWFFKRAERSDSYLDDGKLQHLLVLSQLHFTLTNPNRCLFPGIFAVGSEGYFEPNLKMTLSFGRPLMSAPEFAAPINSFLELIWSKYSPQAEQELTRLIQTATEYDRNYQEGQTNLISTEQLAAQFKKQPQKAAGTSAHKSRKVLISQNGPVVVSQWQPRKVRTTQKETIHA